MYMTIGLATLLVLQCCELFLAIKVPVAWNNGEVLKESNDEFSIEAFKPQNAKPIPIEYFQYTAKKPQFAVEIAATHGVKSPQNYYKAYPVRPHTGREPLKLGIHHMVDEDRKIFQSLQQLVKNQGQGHVTPVLSNYEVFHPYEAEKPALQDVYKDPVFNKIRNDLENSKNRLQKYEKEAGEANIKKDEYLERPEEIDKKLFVNNNVPVEFEIHRPQRQPIYYDPVPKLNHRDHILNKKIRHPWNQNFVKIRPMHYRPLKNHIYNIRQQHAMKYDDERNDYPQIKVSQNVAEPQDGYDIYERGKEKYVQLRNNVDESINKVVQENRANNDHKLDVQNDDPNDSENENDEFVPIKNYAQVRKTEIVKHLPRAAALEDAETYEEIKNAPRLREAVKSTKAQTVYTEEGYEDSAYDHAGEQKHASDLEDHGGYLKQKEISEGKYKAPTFSNVYDDGRGSEYRDQVLHGEKWKDNFKNNQEESEAEEYFEDEQEQSAEVNSYTDNPNEETYRDKRENDYKNNIKSNLKLESDNNKTSAQHEVDKREANFKVPEINLSSTFLSEKDISKIANTKIFPKIDDVKEKYPYYFENLKSINKHSPLRYAENLKFIPKKSKGGTEFYDSRSNFECPEVDDVDPLSDKLKSDENLNSEDDSEGSVDRQQSHKDEQNFDSVKEQPRLRGLGDKIDCFKSKYFGENPLDSPFFKEEIIISPEPVTAPNLETYKLNDLKEQSAQKSISNETFDLIKELRDKSNTDIFVLLNKFRANQGELSDSVLKPNEQLYLTTRPSQTTNTDSKLANQSNIYSEGLDDIKNSHGNFAADTSKNNSESFVDPYQNVTGSNMTYNSIHNKKDVPKFPTKLRKKRATPFIYEPYKIIRDGQLQDSKKTTTTSNISPLIKQMQTSRVVDRVTRANQEQDKMVKLYADTRTYKDIGKNDREKKSSEKGDEEFSDSSFIDVNVDQRRGEPRYELRPPNHKSEYTPVENMTSISIDDYNAQINNNKSNESSLQRSISSRRNLKSRKPAARPVFDVSKYLPTTSTEGQKVSASNIVRRTIGTTTLVPGIKMKSSPNVEPTESLEDSESEEDYEEYVDTEEDEEITTTTTQKPTLRRRRINTTEKSREEKSTAPGAPKLRLVTRFRNYNLDEEVEPKQVTTEKFILKNNMHREHNDTVAPTYREKKKKSTKSTFVTDTKTYGSDDDDNMRKKDVDDLIGVKQDMNDYMPTYERMSLNKNKDRHAQFSEENDEDYDDDDDDRIDDDNEDDDDDDDNNDTDKAEVEDNEEEEVEPEPEVTTPEPTKRTLLRTTDAPEPTIATRTANLKLKPIISKKKIEIHKELPVNNTSPHVTEYKQDIKEIEIIKEIPRVPSTKKPQKNIEAFDLYKDDNLAKEINKLGDVEIFKENLDLENGPRHGGNYRSAAVEPVIVSPSNGNSKALKDAEASQSENTKHIELNDYTPKGMHAGNLKSFSEISRSRNRGRNSKLIELSETEKPTKAMHGGNLRFDSKTRRGNKRYEKIMEFDNDRDEKDDSSAEDNYKTYSSRKDEAMHGGNYRRAKLVQVDDKNKESREHDIRVRPDNSKDARRNAAVLLNSFAQAVPILTTTPGYILDPSKRMYYYVET